MVHETNQKITRFYVLQFATDGNGSWARAYFCGCWGFPSRSLSWSLCSGGDRAHTLAQRARSDICIRQGRRANPLVRQYPGRPFCPALRQRIATWLVLFTLGAGLGLAEASSWQNMQPGATTFRIAVGIWLIVPQRVSFALGGFNRDLRGSCGYGNSIGVTRHSAIARRVRRRWRKITQGRRCIGYFHRHRIDTRRLAFERQISAWCDSCNKLYINDKAFK